MSGRYSIGIMSPGRAGVRSWTAGDASSGANRCVLRPYFAAWVAAVPASVQQAERRSGVFWSTTTRHPGCPFVAHASAAWPFWRLGQAAALACAGILVGRREGRWYARRARQVIEIRRAALQHAQDAPRLEDHVLPLGVGVRAQVDHHGLPRSACSSHPMHWRKAVTSSASAAASDARGGSAAPGAAPGAGQSCSRNRLSHTGISTAALSVRS